MRTSVICGLALVVNLFFVSGMNGQIKTVESFALRNVNGQIWSTECNKEVLGFIVVFTCNHCPFASLYPARLNALNEKYTPLKVPLIAINPMDSLLYEEEIFSLMQTKAQLENFNFPYLQDEKQLVSKQFGAEHTPQAFIIWLENGKYVIKYKGAIDDNGEDPAKATPFLANAVNDLLSNRQLDEAATPSFGCRIFYRK